MRSVLLSFAAVLLTNPISGVSGDHPPGTAGANKAVAIDNGIVDVSFDPELGTFSARRGEKFFVKEARFREAGGGDIPKARAARIEDTLGSAQAIEVEFPSGNVYTLALYSDLPFVCIKSQMHNPTNDRVIINKMVPISLQVDLGKAAEDLRVLGCDGLTSAEKERTSYTFLAMAEPDTRAGVVAGWLTHDRASGIVLSKPDESSVRIDARSEYGNLLIEPGGNVTGETFAIGYFDDALVGLEEYAGAIAKKYRIRLPEIPSGYCTWYSKPHGGASDEEHVAELAEFCGRELTKFGLNLLQIDDKWQLSRRDFTNYNPSGPYPNGMKPTARKINQEGMTAGIWFIPTGWDHEREIFQDHQNWFVHNNEGSVYTVHWAGSCLDMTHPEAREFLSQVISRITRQWGYKYIKIDGLWTGMAVKILYPTPDYRNDNLGDAIFHDPAKTNIEAYRDGLKLVREAAGEDVYILGCNIAQNMRTLGASIGLVDGMRVGRDIGANWEKILPSAAMGTRLYFMHNRVWHNDPDCLMLREPLTLNQARAWGSWIAMTGPLNMVSEWLPGLPPDRLEVLKRSIPNHGACARPVDLFESPFAQIWHLTTGTDENRRDVVGLFNWDPDKRKSISVELHKLNLPDNTEGAYVGFDYWADAFIPPFSDTLSAQLQPSSCRIISVSPVLSRPVLVGTSRHVTQGIADVIQRSWDGRKSELAGQSMVVGGDAYELRIYAPAPAKPWYVKSAAVSEADERAGVTVQAEQAGAEIRVAVISPENRQVSWKVAFKRK
ncbi:MAG: alpha-galactosidase [Phycisphaerales bacterium]|nr:MAG: alpha-galactosidase [Phycisphaerales bacterium]